jgi:predicted nucleic acid-binding protein
MTAAVFVDTNVFIHARDSREPRKQRIAASWIQHLWQVQAGRTSVQVLSEYYVNVTRRLPLRLSPDEAWDDVQTLLAWNPQAVDRHVLEAAREIERRYRLHWWDSQIVAAADMQGCTLLLTEDLQDGASYGGVTVRSPFTLAVSEAASAYAATPAPASRHRPRGRPRKVAAG